MYVCVECLHLELNVCVQCVFVECGCVEYVFVECVHLELNVCVCVECVFVLNICELKVYDF